MGRIHFRVINVVMIEGTPNNNPAWRESSCSFCLSAAPVRLVTPTRNNEYDEADSISIENI
jgi:hypothetical protein